MSRASMAAIRERRTTAGLVQMNLWVRQDEAEAFRQVARPFQDRARVAEAEWQRMALGPIPKRPAPALKEILALMRPVQSVRFPHQVPPASVRNEFKRLGWTYDPKRDRWTVAPGGAGSPGTLARIEDLRRTYGAVVE